MEELNIIQQLKYDIQVIETRLISIENTKEKMKQWIGKPIYKGCEDSIVNWQNEIKESKLMLNEYFKKLEL